MKFDNGKEVKSWTTMDNEILNKISRIADLPKATKDVLISLCRQIFYGDGNKTIRTSWWGAAKVTAEEIGISERQVRRAYDELVQRNIISKTIRLREQDTNGQAIPRNVLWITINTDVNSWKVKERRTLCNIVSYVSK